ncbi:hypothetical protein [Mesorhizobium sp. L48C026A00]|uniref:hypothetical protein n=1 Tax=Mesorhizobium sp. L48C026A00 TaxID=1287182 RepID=UPI0012ECB2D0|nr:hypothetical protein [Mesorhizobium sp. L48C026A00]
MSIDLSLRRAIKWNVPTNQGPLWILDPYPRMLHRSEESRLRAASSADRQIFEFWKNPD